MMILLLNRYSHLPIVPDFLFMVVSRYQYDVASSTGGLAFVLVSFVQVASSCSLLVPSKFLRRRSRGRRLRGLSSRLCIGRPRRRCGFVATICWHYFVGVCLASVISWPWRPFAHHMKAAA